MEKKNRRAVLKTSLGLGVVSSLPSTWVKPVVESVILPTHAQTSATTTPEIEDPPFPTPKPNTPPVGVDVTISANAGETANYDLASDISDNEDPVSSLVIRIINPPSNGTVILTNATAFTYEVADGTGFSGTDSFDYIVEDTGGRESPLYTVTITDIEDF